MSSNDSTAKTIIVAFALCIVCSVIVSTAAVLLKPAQEVNKALDKKRNILAAAGMLQDGVGVEEQFAQIKTRLVDLRTGKYTDEVDAQSYDHIKAAKDSAMSRELTDIEDQAKISRLENYVPVYLVEGEGGGVDKIILPIRGYGLWSTLYGFIALESDANTIAGLGFYEHGETPGLGGEVDNPRWKGLWPGKQVYRDGQPAIELIKGAVNPANDGAQWQVDGLAGATLTARGVTNLVQFWLGEAGFASYLDNVKSGEA
ncbi:MAG: Na(+)-translocating NADH-quinone reductase subunit C [Halioglobus sp.]